MDIFKLVGSVFVDTDEANKSLSKTDKNAEGLGNKLKDGAKTAGKWALGLGTACAAVGTAMVASAKEAAGNMDVIDKASQRMKIGAESYQELAHAAGLSGVEMSTLEQAAKKLEGTDMNLDDALNQIYALGTAEERSAMAAELFGEKVAYNMTPMLNASAEEMAGMRAEAHDLGIVMSEDAVKAGAAMNDTFSKVEESFGAVTNQIGVAVMPVINDVLNWILAHMPEIQKAIGVVVDFVSSAIAELTPIIKSLIPVIKSIWDFISPLWNSMLKPMLQGIIDFLGGVFTGDWSRVFKGLSSIVGGIFNGMVYLIKAPLNLIISAVNAVIGGLNKIKLPSWVPSIGGKGINLPKIPYLAKGGEITAGGSAIVGEAGAELVQMPAGARVTPLNSNNNAFSGMEKRLEDMQSSIYALAQAMAGYKPQIVLDSGMLVGEIAPQIDNELGRLATSNMRGVR